MNPHGGSIGRKRPKAEMSALKRSKRMAAVHVVRKHLRRGQLPYELHGALELLVQDM